MARRSRRLKHARAEETVTVWQPRGFKPCDHLPPELHRYADYARFYVGLIIHLTLRRKRAKLDGWAPISFKFASRFFPGKDVYKAVKDALETSGVVECDQDYLIGAWAMGYRLSTTYRSAGVEKATIRGKPARLLRKKLRHWHQERAAGMDEVLRYLLGWLTKVRVGRYADKCLDPTLDVYPRDLIQLESIRALANHQANFVYPFKQCDFGRVHTPVAHGWSGYRRHLTIDKAHLVGIDLRNSQPLILGLLLKVLCFKGGMTPEWLERASRKRSVGYLDLSPFEIAQPNDGASQDKCRGARSHKRESTRLKGEVKRYVKLCEQGRFYNHMMEHFAIPESDRDKFKIRIFRYVLFGPHRTARHTLEWDQFQTEFPQIACLIRGIKERYGYKSLARLLQRVESSLMIDRVCRRLMREHPKVPVVTIHDAILTTRKHVRLVRRIITEEFGRFGLQPTLHTEDYARMPAKQRVLKPKHGRRKRRGSG